MSDPTPDDFDDFDNEGCSNCRGEGASVTMAAGP
jgi:hypothetical protein